MLLEGIVSIAEQFKYLVFLSPFFYYFVYRKITHPLCIYIGVLSLQYIIYLYFQSEHYSILFPNTELSIFLGLWGFFVGYSFVAFSAFLFKARTTVKAALIPNHRYETHFDKYYNLSIFLSVAVIGGHLFVGYNNGLNGTYSSFFINVRMQYLLDPTTFSLLPHVAIFLQSWFAVLLIHGHRVKSVAFWFLVLSILCALSKFERSSIITSLLALLIIKDHQTIEGVSLKRIIGAILFMVGLFFFVAWQFDKNRTLSDLLFVLLDYFSKNIDTFNKYVSQLTPVYDWSLIVGKYVKLFGGNPESELMFETDGSFNTYSYLKNVYLFGGVYFVFVFNILIGVLFSLLYEARYKFSGFFLVFLSFFSFSLFISFFAYAFAWTNWLYYFISLMLIFMWLNFRRLTFREVE